jgi:DNA-binding winged helix-turn-helix (wHTH) protein/Flp pilus assembly protein TadD
MSAPGNNSPRRVPGSPRLRFGTFEVDLQSRELRNRGMRIRLQEKPFRILELLLERSGGVVTREELVQRLWPGLHVNFERSLNTAVNSLRGALGDSSRSGRFIETRPGIGYRFVAHAEVVSRTNFSLPAVPNIAASAKFGAYEDYLRGRHFYGKMSEDDLRKSVAHFESAIAQDSYYASAYAGLADAYTSFALFGMLSPIEAGSRARDLAAKALQMDGALPEAHAALGAVKVSFDWEWAAAETEYLLALELNPNYAEGHHRYAALLSRMGRTPEAIKQIRRAQELNPLSLAICMEAGWILCMAQDFEAAVEQCWKVLGIEPKFAPAQYTLGLAYERLGMMEEAITEFENARTCSGNSPVMKAALAHTYAIGGMPDEAMAILRQLEETSKWRYISPYWTGMIWTGLGAHDRALDEIEKASEHRDVWLTWLNVEPRFQPIRSHARFWRVLKLVGLGRKDSEEMQIMVKRT